MEDKIYAANAGSNSATNLNDSSKPFKSDNFLRAEYSLKYKFVAADMDGTLLNDSDEISPYTVEQIRKAVSKGLLFSICTGRPIQGVERYQKQLGIQGPVITYNGAMILDSATQKVLYRQELTSSDARLILEAGLAYDTTMCIWSSNQLYGNQLNDRIFKYSQATKVTPKPMPPIEQLLSQGITKILWYDQTDKISRIESDLRRNPPFKEVTFCTSKPFYLEFFSSKVSKAAAIDRICELYHISQDQTIAIGDGFNDLSMIRHAALGVAMKNAPEEVKKQADYVTEHTNNEDGVAEVLEKFVL